MTTSNNTAQPNIYWWATVATYKRTQTCLIPCTRSSKTRNTKVREVRVAVTSKGAFVWEHGRVFWGVGMFISDICMYTHTHARTEYWSLPILWRGPREERVEGLAPKHSPLDQCFQGGCVHTVWLARVLSAWLLCNVSLETHFTLIRRET